MRALDRDRQSVTYASEVGGDERVHVERAPDCGVGGGALAGPTRNTEESSARKSYDEKDGQVQSYCNRGSHVRAESWQEV